MGQGRVILGKEGDLGGSKGRGCASGACSWHALRMIPGLQRVQQRQHEPRAGLAHLVPAGEAAITRILLEDVGGPAQQVAAATQRLGHRRQDGRVVRNVPHSQQQQV